MTKRRETINAMSSEQRKRMAMAHSAHEARIYLLTRCADSAQALRLASALAAVADMLWPLRDATPTRGRKRA